MIEFTERDIEKVMEIFDNEKIPSSTITGKLRELGFKPDTYTLSWLKTFFDNFFDEITAGARYNDDEITARIEAVKESFPSDVGDSYTRSLAEWLASDENRIGYLTTALQSGNVNDGFQALSDAQYEEILEIADVADDFLEWFAKEHDDGIEDEEEEEAEEEKDGEE